MGFLKTCLGISSAIVAKSCLEKRRPDGVDVAVGVASAALAYEMLKDDIKEWTEGNDCECETKQVVLLEDRRNR